MDRTFNQNLMSGVINQVKPFAGIIDTSGQVLEKHTTTVVNNNETLIEQEEVIKRSTFNKNCCLFKNKIFRFLMGQPIFIIY